MRLLSSVLLPIKWLSRQSGSSYGELRTSFNVRMYFIASRSVVIFVNFSFVDVGVPLLIDGGTHFLRFSKALLISRIRVRSRAFAVFRRYLLSGGALGFFFSLVTRPEVVLGSSCSFGRVVWRLWRCRNEYFSSFSALADISDGSANGHWSNCIDWILSFLWCMAGSVKRWVIDLERRRRLRLFLCNIMKSFCVNYPQKQISIKF